MLKSSMQILTKAKFVHDIRQYLPEEQKLKGFLRHPPTQNRSCESHQMYKKSWHDHGPGETDGR